MRVYSRPFIVGSIGALLTLALPAGAQNSPVIVTVNGEPIHFDQPPVEMAGRVFVPLRGVFERLGASVVYDHGHINATRGPITISLTVGATAALVNGQQQYLDNPPFVVGSRVLVPLRFVSQALGTTVNFISATRTVAISVPAGRSMPRRLLDTQATGLLMNLVPADNATAPQHLAQITAGFTRTLDPKSVRAELDGSDVTPNTYVTSRTFVYYVATPLTPGTHTVVISGKSTDGQAMTGSWRFSAT